VLGVCSVALLSYYYLEDLVDYSSVLNTLDLISCKVRDSKLNISFSIGL
jgi:hypothetical protein